MLDEFITEEGFENIKMYNVWSLLIGYSTFIFIGYLFTFTAVIYILFFFLLLSFCNTVVSDKSLYRIIVYRFYK